MPTRRQILFLAAGSTALASMAGITRAQAYPTRPVRILVGFVAGGNFDIVARLIGQWLSEQFHQPVIIENRPGASSNLATEAVVRAPADGYTLLLGGAVNAVNATLYDLPASIQHIRSGSFAPWRSRRLHARRRCRMCRPSPNLCLVTRRADGRRLRAREHAGRDRRQAQ